jgi:uncharacterized delta-60 repeat protein
MRAPSIYRAELLESRRLLADPYVVITGGGAVNEGSSLSIAFSLEDDGPARLTGWSIDWGDGSTSANLPSSTTTRSHLFADGYAAFQIEVTAHTNRGDYSAVHRPGNSMLDTLYDTDGVGNLNDVASNSNRIVQDVVERSDGGLLALVSSYGSLSIRAQTSSGAIDTAFGNFGIARLPSRFRDSAAMIVDEAGRIYVAACDTHLNNRLTLIRFTANGALDTTYSSTGYRSPSVIALIAPTVSDLLTYPDGRLIALIQERPTATVEATHVFRVYASGSGDGDFGSYGHMLVSLPGMLQTSLTRASVKADGRLVLAGHTRATEGALTRATVAQLRSTGQLDTGFSGDGWMVHTDAFSASSQSFADVLALPNGKVLAGGAIGENGKSLLRLNSNGTVDTTYGSAGLLSTPAGIAPARLLPDVNGTILGAGLAGINGYQLRPMLFRLNADQSIDTTFSSVEFQGRNVYTSPIQMALITDARITTDGKLVLVGDVTSAPPSTVNHPTLVRLEYRTGPSVEVANVLPTLSITLPALIEYGTPFTIGLSYSDPGDDHVLQWSGYFLNYWSATGDNPSLTFEVDGTGDFAFSANAIDDDGTRSISRTITIAPPRFPVVNIYGPSTAIEGTTERVSRGSFTHALEPAVYEWDFDYDGATFDADATGHYADVLAADGPRAQTVALRVTNAYASVIDTHDIVVSNVAPVVKLTGSNIVAEGSSLVLTPSVIDPGADSPQSWTLDWGDGTVETFPGNTTSFSHPYPDGPTRFDIRATMTDDDGTWDAPWAFSIPQHVDQTFGEAGQTPFVGGTPNFERVLRLPDDKLLGIGFRQLVRFLPDGRRDSTFGAGGVLTDLALDVTPGNSFVLPDGKIVVTAGFANELRLHRYNPDGTKDSTFGTNGLVRHSSLPIRPTHVVRAGDHFVVAGLTAETSSGQGGLVRLARDGSIDTTFGTAGVALSEFPRSLGGNGVFAGFNGSDYLLAWSSFARASIEMFTSTGARVTNPGPGQFTRVDLTPVSGNFGVSTFEVADNNDLLIAYHQIYPYSTSSSTVARLNSSGQVLWRANLGGVGQTETARSLLPLGDGRLAVGFNTTYSANNVLQGTAGILLVDAAGQVDLSYGITGRVLFSPATNSVSSQFRDLITDGPDRVVLAGGINRTGSSSSQVLSRLHVSSITKVNVIDVAPQITLTGPATVLSGQTYRLDFSAIDPGTDTIQSWTIDWGDGVIDTLPADATSATHDYAINPGNVLRSARVTATNEDGTFVAVKNITVDGLPQVNRGMTVSTNGFSINSAQRYFAFIDTSFNEVVTNLTPQSMTITRVADGAVFQPLQVDAPITPAQFRAIWRLPVLPDGDYDVTWSAGNNIVDLAGQPILPLPPFRFHMLAGDVNRDRVVDFADLLRVSQNYGRREQVYSAGNIDFSNDGSVDFNDLLILIQQFDATVLPQRPSPFSRDRSLIDTIEIDPFAF